MQDEQTYVQMAVRPREQKLARKRNLANFESTSLFNELGGLMQPASAPSNEGKPAACRSLEAQPDVIKTEQSNDEVPSKDVMVSCIIQIN